MRAWRGQRPGGPRRTQRGGFFLGMIVGLLIGLSVALGVALYVTKVPVPFINKVPQRSAEQDAAQTEKNRNWDPNGPLSGRSATRAPASPASAPPVAVAPPVVQAPVAPAASRPSASAATRPAPASPTAIAGAGAASASAKAASAAEPTTYFVQAGAYTRSEDAEQQRANLALMDLAAKITEREQAGRTMYRVRLGPFSRKEEADAAKEKLDGSGIDAALVRVQR